MSRRRTPPPPSADDVELFRTTVGKVKPLRAGRSRTPERPSPAPEPRFTKADERAALVESLREPPPGADLETGVEPSYARPGVQHAVLRKLARGHYRCDAELDLHGLTRARAHAELVAFLASAHANGARCVRIVHGKGHGSGARGPVLRSAVAGWLHRDEVLAYASAPAKQGGSGATLVLLRAAK